MTRAAALLVTLLLCACGGGGALPAPEILSVSPNRLTLPEGTPAADNKRTVRISLDAVIAVHVDYGKEQVTADAVRVWIGAEEATLEEVDPDGTLTVGVPASLGDGTYDVRVTLSDGREAVRTSALTLVTVGVRTGGEPGPDAGILIETDGGVLLDGGSPVEPGPGDPMRMGDVTGFELTTVGEQQQGVPFRLTLRAMGPRAVHFKGAVELTINKRNGSVSPSKLGPFVNGVCEHLVTVDAHGGNVKLTVTDAFGAQGTTNGFRVRQ
ncbi:hypothetical protein [Myxococcus sp. RHSTA-1-4]|uniref:hypothetical protein n=1 Tax=Myxococcus sp. RHSTA-1-4 TaxID=2874601 RepID=UPI001CBEEFF1|nr:hypothetical protein [Myxococcus sp. RHSTA-1-4]MBZ4422089.1 hypothetical protein [Myxococcus sp. RHSTA-1-4]